MGEGPVCWPHIWYSNPPRSAAASSHNPNLATPQRACRRSRRQRRENRDTPVSGIPGCACRLVCCLHTQAVQCSMAQTLHGPVSSMHTLLFVSLPHRARRAAPPTLLAALPVAVRHERLRNGCRGTHDTEGPVQPGKCCAVLCVVIIRAGSAVLGLGFDMKPAGPRLLAK